ncbi:MAG: DUF4288 domain-containing protein [Pseudomonadales bacterium]
MNYSVSVILRPVRSDGVVISLEEQIVLVQASSSEEAASRAIEICRESCLSYEAADGGSISTTIAGLGGIFQIDDELSHGAELFSRHLDAREAEELIETEFSDFE